MSQLKSGCKAAVKGAQEPYCNHAHVFNEPIAIGDARLPCTVFPGTDQVAKNLENFVVVGATGELVSRIKSFAYLAPHLLVC